MEHLEGMNYQIIHEFLLDEMKRIREGQVQFGTAEVKQWWLDELERMNDIAVEEAEKQA